MNKHTPGPWVTGGVSDPLSILSADTWEQVAAVNDALLYDHHNSALIAAAPEMLAALVAAVECGMVPTSSAREGGATAYARQAQVADMVRDAIAKATGGQ